MEVISCDVLVLGSGGAGLRAALAALEQGAEVAVVSKGKTGRNNATFFAGGGFFLPVAGLEVRQYWRITLNSGQFLNDQRLVRIMGEDGPRRLEELRALGVDIAFDEDGSGRAVVNRPGLLWKDGSLITLKQLARLKPRARLVEDVVICRLLFDEKGILGAWGYDYQRGRFLSFSAKAVVLATGGAAAIYSRSTNPPGMTGDGYVLALQAGLPLKDMEFVQYLPLCLLDRPMCRLADVWGRLYNQKDEDIVGKYQLPEFPARYARDKLSIALAKEIAITEKGTGTFVDLSTALTAKSLDSHQREVISWIINRPGTKAGQVAVAPAAHFFMGGVAINTRCETGIPGLYAGGEVAGGVHGANRVAGNALAETLVFGAIAGRNAARYALPLAKRRWPATQVAAEGKKMTRFFSSHGPDPEALRRALKEIMWQKVGIIRTQEGLTEARSLVKELRQKAHQGLKITSPSETKKALELLNMLQVAQVVIEGALLRQESRGAHYRSDFQNTSDVWLRNIQVAKRKEGLKFQRQPVRTDPEISKALDI